MKRSNHLPETDGHAAFVSLQEETEAIDSYQ